MKTYAMKINGQHYDAQILEFNAQNAKLLVNGIEFFVEFEDDDNMHKLQVVLERPVPTVPEMKSEKRPQTSDGRPQMADTRLQATQLDVKAPMPAVIASIKANEGDTVKTGDVLLTLEAMKMESELLAPADGIVQKILVKEKAPVTEGDVLVKLEVRSEKLEMRPVTSTPAPSPVEAMPSSTQPSSLQIKAPLPGTILGIKVNIGDKVQKNQPVFVLEAMKMESEIFSDFEGVVSEILVSKGQTVSDGQLLMTLQS